MTTECEIIGSSNNNHNEIMFSGSRENSKEICQFFYRFKSALKNYDLDISKISVDKNNSWAILLNNNISIMLGEKNIDEKAKSFLRYYNSIIMKYKAVKYVDMRYNRAIAIK